FNRYHLLSGPSSGILLCLTLMDLFPGKMNDFGVSGWLDSK
ncbi:2605_t:CDS:1, partial [Gigaspora rosea]